MDQAEGIRRVMVGEINSNPTEREMLESEYGQVWDTQELEEDFEVIGFMAPFVAVRRKSDGAEGGLRFQDRPRYYWGFYG